MSGHRLSCAGRADEKKFAARLQAVSFELDKSLVLVDDAVDTITQIPAQNDVRKQDVRICDIEEFGEVAPGLRQLDRARGLFATRGSHELMQGLCEFASPGLFGLLRDLLRDRQKTNAIAGDMALNHSQYLSRSRHALPLLRFGFAHQYIELLEQIVKLLGHRQHLSHNFYFPVLFSFDYNRRRGRVHGLQPTGHCFAGWLRYGAFR
ncbi:hypothetical protein [Mesorhizobium sp. L48C026A00]|uniref:hypothetical protein n=1 Tax=Mesorhizobium sp. L48C026A00 TaxID=1287182 RepID=UPI001FD9FEB2|nr:hypothetical protein [Mesorhizobium sp. L48C026A00]